MPEEEAVDITKAGEPEEANTNAPEAGDAVASPMDTADPSEQEGASEDTSPGRADRKRARAERRRAKAEKRKEERAQWRRAKEARRQEREMSRLRRRGLVEGEGSAAETDGGVVAAADHSVTGRLRAE